MVLKKNLDEYQQCIFFMYCNSKNGSIVDSQFKPIHSFFRLLYRSQTVAPFAELGLNKLDHSKRPRDMIWQKQGGKPAT